MYNSTFKELVTEANKKSQTYYGLNYPDKNSESFNPNPYYIGYGNPKSKILILGKEKAFDYEKQQGQLYYESIANPDDWKRIVENNISDINVKYDNSTTKYKNALHPYDDEKPKGGQTWSKYQKLVNAISNSNNPEIINSFFLKSFITEVNFRPSKKSKRPKEFGQRLDFLKHSFYKSFPITILACADYLSKSEIEEIFDVKFSSDSLSANNKRLIVYTGNNRILLNTRQLSINVEDDYIIQLADLTKKYL